MSWKGRKLFESSYRDFVSLPRGAFTAYDEIFRAKKTRGCIEFSSVGNRIFLDFSIYHILKFRQVRNASRGSFGEIEEIMYYEESLSPFLAVCARLLWTRCLLSLLDYFLVSSENLLREIFTWCVCVFAKFAMRC